MLGAKETIVITLIMSKNKRGTDAMSDLVTRYCIENPEMFTKTLARKIYAEHPDKFKDVEEVRNRIRYRRGALGERNKDNMSDELLSLEREQRHIKDIMSFYKLDSDNEGVPDYIIPTSVKHTLLFSDVHIPYHEYDAVVTMFEYAANLDIDSIIINGDLIDFYKASRFTKDPTRRNIKYELDMTEEFFSMLREMFPTQEIYYKLGNHEERYENFFKSKAPELYGDSYYDLDNRLNLAEYHIRYIKSRQLIKYGKLNIIHGHEFGESTFSPVNAARGLFMKAKCSTIAGHNHQISEHRENNLNGEPMATWSVGCLCQLNPEYRPFAYTKWGWGFAILKKDKDGYFEVDNKSIIKNKKGDLKVV